MKVIDANHFPTLSKHCMLILLLYCFISQTCLLFFITFLFLFTSSLFFISSFILLSASHCCVLFFWILFFKTLFCLHLTSSSINFFIASSHRYIIFHLFPQLEFRLGPSSTIIIKSLIFSYNKTLDLIKRTIY